MRRRSGKFVDKLAFFDIFPFSPAFTRKTNIDNNTSTTSEQLIGVISF